MPNAITSTQIQQLIVTINAGNVTDAYDYLSDQGYAYADWANGVAKGNTIAGASAVEFLNGTALMGIGSSDCQSLSQETVQSIKQGMAYEYLLVLAAQAERNGGIASLDINAPDVWKIHQTVFDQNGLSIENWTLNAPFKILQQLGGDQLLEEFWKALRETSGSGLDAQIANLDVLLRMSEQTRSTDPVIRAIAENWLHGVPGILSEDQLWRLKDVLESWISAQWKEFSNSISDFFNTAAAFIQPVRRDPLTLDLDGDGLETVGTAAGVLFDATGNGIKVNTGWVKVDDGLLVLDKNGNGGIDSGRELFGDATLKRNGQLATDGFDALRDLDSNNNGKLDAGDAQFNNLRVWRDLNQNGTTQTGELYSLGQLGIASINVGSSQNSQRLANGNQIADLGTYTKTDGSTGTTGEVTGNLADINFVQNTFRREFADHPDTRAVANLPDLQGSGAVRDLREAASLSPELAATLSQLGGTTTRAELKAAVKLIVQQWADSANFSDSFETADSQGKDLFFVPPGVTALDAYNARYGGGFASVAGGSASTSPLSANDLSRYATIRSQQANIERLLKTVEAFNGRDFVALTPNATSSSSTVTAFSVGTPTAVGGLLASETPAMYNMEQGRLDLLTQSYNQLLDSVYSALVLQTRLKPYLDAIALKVDAHGISLDFTGLDALLDSHRQNHAVNAFYDLFELNTYMGKQLTASGWDFVGHLRAWVEQAVGHADQQAVLSEMGVIFGSGTLVGLAKGDLIFGRTTNDTLSGNDGDDMLSGGQGVDTLAGGNGNDSLDGGAGNDSLSGGPGNDSYWFGRGDGQDTLQYDYDTAGDKLNLLQFKAGILPSEVALARVGDDLVVSVKGTTDKVTVVYFFTYDDPANPFNPLQQVKFADGTVWDTNTIKATLFAGTAAADTVVGTPNADTISGQGGADALYGRGGNDTLGGGDGNDALYGEGGNDGLDGGAGNDSLDGGPGNDSYWFGRGDGQDTLQYDYDTAGDKLNLLQFKAGILPDDVAAARVGDDLVVSVKGTTDKVTVVYFFTYDDPANPFNPLQQVKFADGTVWDTNTIKATLFAGTAAADTTIGTPSHDSISGQAGNDTLYGRNGNDSITGGGGNDALYGENGNDSLFGEDDNDTIEGGLGNDLLEGGNGNDVLNGGEGSDNLAGGIGKDAYFLNESSAVTDIVRLISGDSALGGFDNVNGFKMGVSILNNNGVDKLDLPSQLIAADVNAVDGVDSGLIHSHRIANGLISFDDIDHFTTGLTLGAKDFDNVLSYLQNNITAAETTVAFTMNGSSYVFQDNESNDTLIQLADVAATGLSTTGLNVGVVWIV